MRYVMMILVCVMMAFGCAVEEDLALSEVGQRMDDDESGPDPGDCNGDCNSDPLPDELQYGSPEWCSITSNVYDPFYALVCDVYLAWCDISAGTIDWCDCTSGGSGSLPGTGTIYTGSYTCPIRQNRPYWCEVVPHPNEFSECLSHDYEACEYTGFSGAMITGSIRNTICN